MSKFSRIGGAKAQKTELPELVQTGQRRCSTSGTGMSRGQPTLITRFFLQRSSCATHPQSSKDYGQARQKLLWCQGLWNDMDLGLLQHCSHAIVLPHRSPTAVPHRDVCLDFSSTAAIFVVFLRLLTRSALAFSAGEALFPKLQTLEAPGCAA